MAIEWDLNHDGVFIGMCGRCNRDSVPMLIAVDP